MIYTERESLTVMELTEERDTLSYDELIPLLMERPSNVIYVELHGMLYGIVTKGRIARTHGDGKREVQINKNFTAVYQEANALWASRRLFKENEKVSFVPVLDSEQKLLGEYSKWDDWLIMERSKTFLGMQQVFVVPKNRRIALVKPCLSLEKRMQLFLYWKEFLEERVCSVEIIEPGDIPEYLDEVDFILFADAFERHGLATLYQYMIEPVFAGLSFTQMFSCGDLFRLYDVNSKIPLKPIQSQDVCFLPFGFFENKDGYLKKLQRQIKEKYRCRGLRSILPDLPVPLEIQKGFYDEFYDKYTGQMAYVSEAFPGSGASDLFLPELAATKDGFCILADVDTPFVHVYEGKRQTIGQPEEYKRCVYICGPCYIMGAFVEDSYTISSLLQKKLNEADFPCKVINLGLPGGLSCPNIYLSRILGEDLKQGDIIAFDIHNYDYDEESLLPGTQVLNLTDVLEESQARLEWFLDDPRHCNHKVNQIYAEAIYEKLLPFLRQSSASRETVAKNDNVVKQLYIDPYFSDFDAAKYEKIGSIVMNCNPFTFGHRYLIEYAARQVDFLIIFVVREDASLFSFEERFAMVCDGTADLKNVKVVPSGEFILSKRSFPEYFVKEADKDLVKNTENDIMLFAEKIAPELGITHRFVGEELEDKVTEAYNQAMKRILPAHGIELVEIPRRRHGKDVISASRVRKCLEENELEALNTLVPESTKRICFGLM